MARNKSPRKRKPGQSGQPSSTSRLSRPVYPKRFLVSAPPEDDEDAPAEFFYDSQEDAVRHCVHLGPQFFLDTQRYPPVVNIIRGFEATSTGDSEAIIEHMPADEFLVTTELGLMPVSFSPWDKHTDNWEDRPDELDCDCDCDCGQHADFRFTGKIPGL